MNDPQPHAGETMTPPSDSFKDAPPASRPVPRFDQAPQPEPHAPEAVAPRSAEPRFAEPGSAAPGSAAVEAGDGPDALMQAASERIGTLEAELEAMREKWMRSEAETQNVRNRARRDVDDARQYAVQKFAKDVVEAAENLRRGLASLPPADANDSPVVTRLREGFEGVERSFLGILERNGITGADPTGAAFDANLHQAMAEQPTADHPPGTVIQAWTSAWTLNGRLLKPAMVVVAKAPDVAQATEATGFDRTV